jgi:Flp pilus assembly protein TadD
LYGECLRQLRDGRHAEALETARQCFRLSAHRDAARLLAVAYSLNGDFAAAITVLEQRCEK